MVDELTPEQEDEIMAALLRVKPNHLVSFSISLPWYNVPFAYGVSILETHGAMHADENAALNIRARGKVNSPMVSEQLGTYGAAA